MTLHDRFLPDYDFSEVHSISINCEREKIVKAMVAMDFRKSFIICVLFFLRGISHKTAFGIEGAKRMGFTVLEMRENEEIILGLIGEFWKPTGGIQRFNADQFTTFDPRFVKATWNFKIIGDHVPYIVETETRVSCPTPDTRKKFSRYWRLVRPFSGLIRMEMLKAIRAKCGR